MSPTEAEQRLAALVAPLVAAQVEVYPVPLEDGSEQRGHT